MGIFRFRDKDGKILECRIGGRNGGGTYETVDSVAEMIDTSKAYILSTTGTLWRYLPVETEAEVDKTEPVLATDDNPAYDGKSMGTSGLSDNAEYVVSPYIDLHKYGFPCTLNLNGLPWITQTVTGKIRVQTYNENKELILQYSTALSGSGYWPYAPGHATIIDDTHATVSFPGTYIINSSNTVRYLRFSTTGKWADADISVAYKATDTTMGASQWVDTGVVVGDVSVFSLLNAPVKNFMSAANYSDSDYTSTVVSSYCGRDYLRKDLPLPVLLTWERDPLAVEYTVAPSTAESVPASSAAIYYTADNKAAIYNLIPGKAYYYKVHGLLVTGEKKLLKTGSFSTAPGTRLLAIDGIQNVRDVGGYVVAGKRVRFGMIYRGSAMDEDTAKTLGITDAGKVELLRRVGVKVDLDLRYGKTESPLGPGVSFVNTTTGYENYATAFTNATQRGNFKALLESIVANIAAGAPVYIHCQGGCDRTGTLVFQLLGLLGVSESDLAKEYELSSFSAIGYTRTRNSDKYRGMVDAVKAYAGDTLTAKFEAFAAECGVSAETVTEFRNLMLE